MDFFSISKSTVSSKSKAGQDGYQFELYPDFINKRSSDLMIKGGAFYAVYDEDTGLWSTDKYDVVRLVDKALEEARVDFENKGMHATVKRMASSKNHLLNDFNIYTKQLDDSFHDLDQKVIFADQTTKVEDYASKKLPYSLASGDLTNWNHLVKTLYDKDERLKIEWSIGSIFAGASIHIDKFFVFYGDPGTGKSTILDTIEHLFNGYTSVFNAKNLANSSNQFALEILKKNPLVAIQQDGDLSKIEDNTLLNSIISHETIQMNEKYKSGYPIQFITMLFMGTNKPVKFTDSRSGMRRRLVDIRPTGKKIPYNDYRKIISQLPYEYGAIAKHCMEVFEKYGENLYADYVAIQMEEKTNLIYNFLSEEFDFLSHQDGITLAEIWDMYQRFCDSGNYQYKGNRGYFQDELKSYFQNFYKRTKINDEWVRNYYQGFRMEKFMEFSTDKNTPKVEKDVIPDWLKFTKQASIFDKEMANQPAQLTNDDGYPRRRWDNVKTQLSDLDTHQLHYVKVPENHIVIDLDIKNTDGVKDKNLNLREASQFLETYAEYSKSGEGVHLHYIYDGDPSLLAHLVKPDVEIKVYRGNAALRRKLTECNDRPIAHMPDGALPKKEKEMISYKEIKDEQHIRNLIAKAFRKEIHPNTTPNVSFICTVLDEAFDSGVTYDVSDLRQDVIAFASGSTHQAPYCLNMVTNMKFQSKDILEKQKVESDAESPIVFFDVEVFQNVFIICYKMEGTPECVRLINPDPEQVQQMFKYRLIGFNNRRYDNHILWAWVQGYSNMGLYQLSQRIINSGKGKDKDCFFGQAYNLSYTDIYDYCSSGNKMSLKKWEFKLGIHHVENQYPWDEPLDKSHWAEVTDYCCNDVKATEAVWNATQGDFKAREILADITGRTVNDTTNSLSMAFIFGDDPAPQKQFVYTDLSKDFPGYEFKRMKSTYKGYEVGEGGFVYVQEGIYTNVALLDVASLHPTSLIEMNMFGDKYTKRFKEIKDARIAAKHNDTKRLSTVLDGELKKFVNSPDWSANRKDLVAALKTVINSVYGLTAAHFPNKAKDPRNIDNIVAKRGALFMVNLLEKVKELGYTVVHIKTDSIKIANADPYIVKVVMDYGHEYGYTFELEAVYDRMAIVNKAVYISKLGLGDDGMKQSKVCDWSATGKQFQEPYVFKTLFSHEDYSFDDLVQHKSAKTPVYICKDEKPVRFVGKEGNFVPVMDTIFGGDLMTLRDGKFNSISGTKGYRWQEAEVIKNNHNEDQVDLTYFDSLADAAKKAIEEYIPGTEFTDSIDFESKPTEESRMEQMNKLKHFM